MWMRAHIFLNLTSGPEETRDPVSMNAAQFLPETSKVLRRLGFISVDTRPHVLLRPPQHRLAPVSADRGGLLHIHARWVGPGLGRPLQDAQALQEAVQKAAGATGDTTAFFQAPAVAC